MRRMVVLRLALLLVVTTLTLAVVWVRFGLQPMAERSAAGKFQAVSARVDADMRRLFGPPAQLLQMGQAWLGGKAPDLQDPRAFNHLFQPALMAWPHVTSVVAGTDDGRGWLLLRQSDGSWRNRMTDIPRWGSQRHRIFEQSSQPGAPQQESWSTQTYDPRLRPWFTAASADAPAATVAWTAPYRFFTTGDVGVTASLGTRLADGRRLVLGVDMMLRDLSLRLANVEVSPRGMVLVLTADNQILGLPKALLHGPDWQKRLLLKPDAIGMPVVPAALQSAEARQGQVVQADGGDERWLASLHPYATGSQSLKVLILAPASDFAPAWGPIVLGLLGATTLLFLFAMVVVRAQAQQLIAPLEALVRSMQRIAARDFGGGNVVQSRVREIAELAQAQDQMRDTLAAHEQRLIEQDRSLQQQLSLLQSAQQENVRQNQLLSEIIENFPGGISVFDSQLRLIASNRQFAQLLELPEHLFQSEPVRFEDLIRFNAQRGDYGPGDPEQHVQQVVARARQFVPHRLERTTSQGATLEVRGAPLPGGGFVTLYSDVSEHHRMQVQLTLAASVFTTAQEGIIIADARSRIVDVNAGFTRITGYPRAEVLGKTPRFLQSGAYSDDFYRDMWHAVGEHGFWHGEIWDRRKDGVLLAVELEITAVRDASGEVSHYVALLSDITRQKAHERELEHIAYHDALTGLPNRTLLSDRLQQARAQTLRNNQQLAVVYVDLDGFKAVNDAHGHEVGDELLSALAARMKAVLRGGDTLARIGGDEFVAVLVELGTVAEVLPALLRRLLEAASEPVQVGTRSLRLSASLGVAVFPQTDEVDADQLLRQADQAMYQAKQAGRNRYHLFDSEHDRTVRGHNDLVRRLEQALDQGEFVLHYQPKVNMRSGEVVGSEALIRWQHPERGLVMPPDFLPLIEGHPLTVRVGEWVLHQALAQIEIWMQAGLNLPVSVNIGARQFQRGDFFERLRTILSDHPNCNPRLLELEVLETSALENLAGVSRLIEDCAGMGVRFALDDFGTGYSSLAYLKRLPVTTIKVDREFVRDMLDDPDDLSILDGVLGLARAFGRTVIAEGVETVEHGVLLLQLGCELAQGYGIARPMPAEGLQQWATHWRADPGWAGVRRLPRADVPLLFALVDHRAWVAAILETARGERSVAPPLNLHACRFGRWLDEEGRARYATSGRMEAIDALHQRIHALAIEILAPNGATSERLATLTSWRDVLLDELHAVLQSTRAP